MENWAGDLNGEVWPLIEDEGESLAFFHMISEGLVSPFCRLRWIDTDLGGRSIL